MKTLVIILMLANFAGVAFGRGVIPNWLYFSLMPIMILLLVAYWFVMFWFSKKKLLFVVGEEPVFEIYAGRVPKNPVDDLQRGRLIVKDGKLILYQKIQKENKIKEVWSLPISQIKSAGFGMLLPLRRNGVRLFLEDDNVEFCTRSILKRKDEFYRALGWEVSQNTEIQTGK